MKIAYALFGINTEKEKRIGLKSYHNEFLNKRLVTSFNYLAGENESDEKIIEKLTLKIQEQTGFAVKADNIFNYGKILVDDTNGTYCLLFGVEVDMLRENKKESDRPDDLESSTIWHSLPEIIKLEDWASILITTKRMAMNNSSIHVKNI